MPTTHSPEALRSINDAHNAWEAQVAALPDIDPLPAYTKTHRIFVWTVMYLDEKPSVIAALKRQYSDVCSGGDLAMQELIKFLEREDNSPAAAVALYSSTPVVKYYWTVCWDYMRQTLKNWLDKGQLDADAYWAD
jgi:hypothetical protein